jgi:hypothetical protein
MLSAKLAQAKQILTKLTTLAEAMYNNSRDGVHVNRLLWLRKRPIARKLQMELKNTREALHMLLSVQTR